MPHKATPEAARPAPVLTSAWLSRARKRAAKLRNRYEACDPAPLQQGDDDIGWHRIGAVLDLADRVAAALAPVLRSGDVARLQEAAAELWKVADKTRPLVAHRKGHDLPEELVPGAVARLDQLLTFVRRILELSERASRLHEQDARASREYLAYVQRWNEGIDELASGVSEADEWGPCTEALQVYEAYLTLLCRYEAPSGQDLVEAFGADHPEAVATVALEGRVQAMFTDLMDRVEAVRADLGMLAD